MTKKLDPIVKVLRKASRLIENGWVQKTDMMKINGKVCYCAYGAVEKASEITGHGKYLQSEVAQKAMDYLQRAIPFQIMRVVVWNDRPDTKHKDVKKVFRLAVKAAEEASKS